MSNFDPVPWMVEGGAKHKAQVGRSVAYAAFGGNEGIVSPKDLEVRELAVPGPSVRMFPGTGAILNRATGARDELYVSRLPVEQEIPIAATDSSGGRSDLICAIVKNPWLAGETWPEPADPAVGPYVDYFVISDVPPTTTTVKELGLGYSAIACARADLPASTATVTQDMITDLRKLAAVRSAFSLHMPFLSASEQLGNTGVWTDFPSEANFDIEVPEWATHAKVSGMIFGLRFGADDGGAANVNGNVRLKINDDFSQVSAFNVSLDAGEDRTSLMAGAGLHPLEPAERGTVINVAFQTNVSAGNGELRSGAWIQTHFLIEFTQAPESNL